MAKGFTVKAAAPTKPKEDWDYQAIKERMRGKSIVFCLPGRNCSYTFLKSFVQLAFDLVQNGRNIQISQDYSSMVNFARPFFLFRTIGLLEVNNSFNIVV